VVLAGVSFFFGGPGGTPGIPLGVVYFPFFPFGFGWVWGLFGIFFVFWIFRWIFWGWGGGWGWGWGWGWGYRGRYWRRYDQAVAILRERYAKGEITKEQFDQMMRDLEAHERQPGNI
jgi:putative membrane protein